MNEKTIKITILKPIIKGLINI